MKNKPTKQNREHVVWSFHWFPKLFFSAFCKCWQNAIFDLVFEKEKERRLAFLFQPLGLPVFCLRICFWNKNRFQNWIILVAMPSPKNCCTSSVAVLNTSSLFLFSVCHFFSECIFFLVSSFPDFVLENILEKVWLVFPKPDAHCNAVWNTQKSSSMILG